MSDSEEPTNGNREPHADRCLVSPLDLASELSGLVPRAIERGRGQIKLARALGRLVVEHSPLGPLPALRQPPVDAPPARPAAATPATPPAAVSPASGTIAGAPDETAAPSASALEPTVPVDDLALPDYDSLSASQVIPRLQGLDPGELEDLRRYEAAGRSRRTILNKIAQLQSPS
jgi:hypothetical protein